MKLFNKKVYEEASDENKELLDDYMLELEVQGKAEKSRYQYSADIKGFICYLKENKSDKYILDLKRKDFRNFFLVMSRGGTSAARINRFQSSLRNFLEYAVISDDYDYEINEMAHIKGVTKDPVRDIVFLTDNQVNILLDYLVRRKQYQKALYVSLSYDSGGRRNEVLQVQKEGFVENHQTNEVIGKRGKHFSLIYFDRTREIAKLWLEKRGEDDVDGLWITHHNGETYPLTYDSFYQWCTTFRKILKKTTGEDIEVSPHSFRHSAFENYTQGNHHALKELGKTELPLDIVQLIAHHSNISTTQSYLQNHDDEKLESALGIKL